MIKTKLNHLIWFICFITFLFFGNSQIVLSSDNTVVSDYMKANWKGVQFSVYNKERNSTDMHIVGIGETLEVPYSDLKVYVREALVNPSQPQNAAVNIVAYRDDKEIFSGLIYQSFPIINPFEKSGYGGYKGFELRFITGHPSIQISSNANKFIADKDGKLYLLYKNSLYYKYNDSGDGWSRVGENIKSLAIDPNNKDIFYIITAGNSVQKSMDGGKGWTTITNGLPSSHTTFFNIVINPHNSQEVFVLTGAGLYKTSDAGFSWSQTNFPHNIARQFLIHPNEKNIYYAKTYEELYISKDAGITWNKISDTLPKRVVKGKGRTAEQLPIAVKSVVLLNFDKPTLLAITEENGILKTEDNGIIWKEFNNGFNKDDGAYSIYTTNSDIYIGSYDHIYHLKNDSDRWNKIDLTKADDKAAVAGIDGIYPLEGDKGFIITDSSGKIIHVDKDKNLIGLNYGVMPHSKILALGNGIVDGQQRIYASVENNNYVDIDEYGLFYSSDNGKTWEKSVTYERPYGSGAHPRLYISPHNNNEMRIFDGSENHGLYTYDGGKKWDGFRLSLEYLNDKIYDFDYDPIDKNVKYACAAACLFRYQYVASSGQSKWIKLKESTTKLIIAQDDNKKLLTDSLNLSLDGGWTWKDISQNLKEVVSGKYQPIYFSSEEIITFVHRWDVDWGKCKGEGCIVSSKDLGNTWKILYTISTIGTGECIVLVYANPMDANNIFVAYKDDKNIIITQSLDKGVIWKPFAIYKPSGDEDDYMSLTVAKEEADSAVYLGTVDGLYKTVDNGETWELLGGIKTTEGSLLSKFLKVSAPEILEYGKDRIMDHIIEEKKEASPVQFNGVELYDEVMNNLTNLDDKESLEAHIKYNNGHIKIGGVRAEVRITISENGEIIFEEGVSVTGDYAETVEICMNAPSFRNHIYKSAVNAVTQWQFKPFTIEGVKVKVEGVVGINVEVGITKVR